jgi:hypothetical protein
MLFPSASADAQASLASVAAAIFSAIIRQHSSAPSAPPRTIFNKRIAITPCASKLNSIASIQDFQNNTVSHLLLHRETTIVVAAPGSADAVEESLVRGCLRGAANVLSEIYKHKGRSPRVRLPAAKAALATPGQPAPIRPRGLAGLLLT